jgi:hypothetical protein
MIQGILFPEIGPQTIPFIAKAKKRMETGLGKMAVVGHSLLLAVRRVIGGIHIDNQALCVFPLQ